jgi:hypothetical protein
LPRSGGVRRRVGAIEAPWNTLASGMEARQGGDALAAPFTTARPEAKSEGTPHTSTLRLRGWQLLLVFFVGRD